MPAKIKFKKSMLAHCIHHIFNTNDINKLLCASVFLSVFATPSLYAAENVENEVTLTPSNAPVATEENKEALVKAAQQQGLPDNKIDQIDEKVQSLQNGTHVDSLKMLQQQERNVGLGNEFKPIQFDELENLPETAVDPNLAAQINQEAEQAKAEAEAFRAGISQAAEVAVSDANQTELTAISQAPVNIDQLIQEIQADNKVSATAQDANIDDSEIGEVKEDKDKNFFQRLIGKLNPRKANGVQIPRISVSVTGGSELLNANIKAKLSSFPEESFKADPQAAIPQLRTLANQAAQAVGYYEAEFKFNVNGDSGVKVTVTPNSPVLIREQNIDFTGAGSKLAQFQVIKVLPDQEPGDIFNHGSYEQTKAKISDAATNNGFFDGYWRMHDVMVARPDNKADINLKYETGSRYKMGDVEFRMSDPKKKLPIREEILRTLAPWKEGADYTGWRVNVLASNLTNTRYFNYTMVDAIKPDPIDKPLELPPDLQALVDDQNISESLLTQNKEKKKLAPETEQGKQVAADENQFAGVNDQELDQSAREAQALQKQKQTETESLQDKARADKKIPVIVTLNADRLNSLEAGIGYGTDTGVRLRSQYRRAIVNDRGHSFDANLELSQIRQSIDTRYNIPYKHPLNDYFGLVAGYERESRDTLGNGLDLVVESAVLGADRIIKGARKDWQHILGVRYRLDRVSVDGDLDAPIDIDDIPDAFLAPGASTKQQSLLLGYEATKTISDNRVNPTRGFKQNYKIQAGSKSLLSDADMVIANANWKFLYSLGENNDHQFVGGLNAGYIFTNEFEKVPYNLRFFAGGDQSLRGFDYKSLSPEDSGFKIGGQALAVGTLEYNYQFKEGWRAAVFGDYGNAFDKSFSNPAEYSLGLGIRWTSPIGPIRLDVAAGLSDPDRPIRMHFFIGSQL
ncbi:autotransporter assembly complex protein TamA [Acinetobacter shaoyimingii]|uniref:Translocation and assembly module subunit TamA n=1 Tax=Acinetobacter shaoyimingii TaxID=2715164 RepID=A0A6G8RWF7_9GAMM|nr:autotransporter assembly complex family protein [Acinetobacter shaoyimingii]QIO06217.1 outer membrane protein assembly factor [Acinetobacter shaoyimingii]